VSLDDSAAETVLVLALGNPLMGDDGIGVRVVEELKGRELPSGVALADGGTTGLALVGLMEEYQRVIAVDAADMGQPPGCVRKFAPSEVRLRRPVICCPFTRWDSERRWPWRTLWACLLLN
jgi:Ni,Fe-hydrogenase maturation factor